jgi:hypothetical protein
MPLLPTDNTVTYRCYQISDKWSPGTFALPLVVTAGEDCCLAEGQATATVTITDQPTVTVLTPIAPVTICEDSQEPFVEVEFTVQADTADLITLPPTIKPTFTSFGGAAENVQQVGPDCVATVGTSNCKWEGCMLE